MTSTVETLGTKGLVAGALIAQRYRLSAPLGAGTQGSVWEAVDIRHGGALCAIKFTPTDSSRHREEAEVLLELEHPSLPKVLDYGTHENSTFLVLERIAGVPLHPALGTRTILQALVDVAEALAVLHDHGFVHGDVKPANILVGNDRAWLVDLGLVSVQGSGVPAGTLAFMPPEALVGERGPASDLYALGVTAALTLTGMHPLVEDPHDREALLTAIAQRTRPRERVIAALPPACRNTISTLFSLDPEQRPTSARAWIARLARDAEEELSPTQRARILALGSPRAIRPPLVGRERERARAREALAHALTHGGGGLVFTGPPGSGRRRLVNDAIRAIRVAWAARGTLPEVVDDVPTEPTRPTIVRCIDADAEHVRTVALSIVRMARYCDGAAPVALIASTTEPVGVPELVEISVGPLDTQDFAALLEALAGRLPEPHALTAWLDVTAGLPGNAVALAEALGTDAIATATREELTLAHAPVPERHLHAEISPEAHQVLLVLAAAQEPLTPTEIAGILGIPSAARGIREIVGRGLALERDGCVRLLTTSVDLQSLEPEQRIHLGSRLESYFSTYDPGRASVRARAALLRNDRPAARTHAAAAADAPGISALSRIHWLTVALESSDDGTPFALRLATEWITQGEPRRALQTLAALPPAPEVLALQAEALRRAGEKQHARNLALALEHHPDPAAQTVARIVLARDALDRGDATGALARLGPLADGQQCPAALCTRALEAGALAALASGDANGALRRIERALQLSRAQNDRVQHARLRSLQGMALQLRGEHTTALQAYREAWTLATEAGDAHGAATYAVNLGAAELECGALGEAAHWLARGARALARLGRMEELARALANLASLRAFLGDRAGAIDHAHRAEQAAREAGDAATEALAQLIAAEVSLQGIAAGDALATAAEAALRGGHSTLAAEARARAAIHYARGGNVTRARETLAMASEAPAPLRSLAALEISLAAGAAVSELTQHLASVRQAVANEGTLEYQLAALRLALEVAERSGDASQVRDARAALEARVETLAATLPEELATLFRDAHRVAVRWSPTVSHGSVHSDVRWRRLAEITRELNREQRLQPLLERVMDAIVELTGAARGFLLLEGPDGVLRIRTARNIGRRDLTGQELALSRSVAERVARTGEALITVDAASDQRFDAFESVHAMRLRSILAVPLRVQGTIVGTIYVDDRFRRGAFGNDALEIAQQFAEAAAVAIHNARTQTLLRRALRKSERLARELRERFDAQTVELEATRRALAHGPVPVGHYEELVGRGPAMLRTLQLIDKVAPTAMPVLLLGESGTGKELVARAIHANSPRNGKPFVAENCGAIPETLLESVLFGHVRGAFTGADRNRRGLFEIADGGTLFLDEVGEMSPAMQAKLLRVLQDGEIRPLGSERTRRVDVRVIAATHRDLGEMVRQGQFREDLYYRLAVMVIPIPPLRDRREDIPELVAHFIQKHAGRKLDVERKALARLISYSWPGNVRQLENEVMRACALADGIIREEDLSPALLSHPVAVDGITGDSLDLRRAVENLERQLIERALREHGGNQSRAAQALGLSRFGLQKKLKRLGYVSVTKQG